MYICICIYIYIYIVYILKIYIFCCFCAFPLCGNQNTSSTCSQQRQPSLSPPRLETAATAEEIADNDFVVKKLFEHLLWKLIVNFQTLCKTTYQLVWESTPLGSGYSNSEAQNKFLSDHFDIGLSSILSIVVVVQY